MYSSKLIIGMPAGSLANASRGGNLIQLLNNDGFETRGYEDGGPTDFKTINYLFGWDAGSQKCPTLPSTGYRKNLTPLASSTNSANSVCRNIKSLQKFTKAWLFKSPGVKPKSKLKTVVQTWELKLPSRAAQYSNIG